METNMLIKGVLIVCLVGGIIALDTKHVIERLNYIEDRLNSESKFRRHDFSVLFQKLEDIETKLHESVDKKVQGIEQLKGDISTESDSDQSTSQETTFQTVLLNAFKEEKKQNIRFWRQTFKLEENIKHVEQTNGNIVNTLKEIVRDIKTSNERTEEMKKSLKNNIETIVGQTENIDDVKDKQEMCLTEIEKNTKTVQELVKIVGDVADNHERCMAKVEENVFNEMEELAPILTKPTAQWPISSVVYASVKPETETYKTCLEWYESGHRTSGVYQITLQFTGEQVDVYCDMSTDTGGWTVFQRRQDGSVDFYRNWDEYKSGFGDLNGEFWFGNEYLNKMTDDGEPHELRIELEDHEGNRAYAKYRSFKVGPESTNYKLEVSGYSGSAGDSLIAHHNGMAFTTKDRDNDKDYNNCAQDRDGAWWYNSCAHSNLNGVYHNESECSHGYATCVIWYHWKGHDYSLKFTEMKFR